MINRPTRVLALALMPALALVASVEAQNRTEELRLRPGFTPSMQGVSGRVEGKVEIANFGDTAFGPCRGYIGNSPVAILNLQRNFEFLRLRVRSGSDTALYIRGPDGLRCNDDFDGLDPVVQGAYAAGRYEVFVATVSGPTVAEYMLEVTEQGRPEPSTELGRISLRAGFLPDPQVHRGHSNGDRSIASIPNNSYGSCNGKIPNRPSAVLNLPAALNYLRVYATSANDTSLYIRGPDGERCSDDVDGLNPAIEGAWPAGDYEVYVGTFNPSSEWQLHFSEIRGATPNSGGSSVGVGIDGALNPGFIPDPRVLTGLSGGSRDARDYGDTRTGRCTGQIATSEDHLIELGGDFNYLRFQVESSADTSLVILGPEGILCNDDAVGLNPVIDGRFRAGRYQIFVGSVGGGLHAYELKVSELRN